MKTLQKITKKTGRVKNKTKIPCQQKKTNNDKKKLFEKQTSSKKLVANDSTDLSKWFSDSVGQVDYIKIAMFPIDNAC